MDTVVGIRFTDLEFEMKDYGIICAEPGCRSLCAVILYTKNIVHSASENTVWDLKIVISADGDKEDAVILPPGFT